MNPIPAPAAIDIALMPGDVIHAVNNRLVSSLNELNLVAAAAFARGER